MEKIILAVETHLLSDERIGKQLLRKLMEKTVPGFCTEVVEACKVLHIGSC